MPSTTANLSLTIPDTGDVDWDGSMDTNLTVIDTHAGEVKSFNKFNAATMTTPATPSINLANGRILRFPLTTTVTSVTLTGTGSLPDGEITVIVEQPSGGNCAFAWPSLFQSAGDLSSTSGNLGVNTISIQKFTYHSSLGKAYANGPMVTGAK